MFAVDSHPCVTPQIFVGFPEVPQHRAGYMQPHATLQGEMPAFVLELIVAEQRRLAERANAQLIAVP